MFGGVGGNGVDCVFQAFRDHSAFTEEAAFCHYPRSHGFDVIWNDRVMIYLVGGLARRLEYDLARAWYV